MPPVSHVPPSQTSCRGVSLIELGLVMVIITLALAPIVRMIGGPQSATGEGSAVQVTASKSKETLQANSIIEQVLSGDYTPFNCGNPFNVNSLPLNGRSVSFPANGRCAINQYSQPKYYQWKVRNLDDTGTNVPQGNHYYKAVLNIYDSQSGSSQPILSLPTNFFRNETVGTAAEPKTGILIVLDTSSSMAWGICDGGSFGDYPSNSGSCTVPYVPYENAYGPAPNIRSNVNRPGSPYLWYRYEDPAEGYVPRNPLPWNRDDQLDIVSAYDSNLAATEWDDRYPSPGVLGFPDCSNNSNQNSAFWRNYNVGTNPAAPFPIIYTRSNKEHSHMRAVCNATGGPNNAWINIMNRNMSRLEAARTALLGFMLSIERNPSLYRNVRLGFVTFSSNVVSRVPLEGVNAANRFPNIRRSLSWVNRGGPGIIPPAGSTHMLGALDQAARIIFADPTLDNRIILFVGDGSPSAPSPTSHAPYRTLATRIGNGTYPGANGKKATIFTLNLLSNDGDIDEYLEDDIASRTPGGRYFPARSMGDVTPIFDQVKYQIQRVVLMNRSTRYNVDFR